MGDRLHLPALWRDAPGTLQLLWPTCPRKKGQSLDFRGIPIPMAAGFIASVTYLLIYFSETERQLGHWNWVLAGRHARHSLGLMISNLRYPSFKKVDFQTRGTPWGILGGALLILLLIIEQTRWYTPTLIFTLYLIYGLIRPLLSKKLRHSIEEAVDGDPDSNLDSDEDIHEPS